MEKGQGSTEYLVLLAAALLIALAVVGILAYYPGTTEDAKKTQSDLYWRSAKPIAILEAYGSTTPDGVGFVRDTAILVVKNLDNERITITNITINDNAWDYIYYGNDRTSDALNHTLIGTGSCSSNCSISLPPGQVTTVQVVNGLNINICNAMPDVTASSSANSVRKSAEVGVKIYYQRSGVTKLEASGTKLVFQCQDYWVCSSDAQCTARYPNPDFPDCNSGACTVVTG